MSRKRMADASEIVKCGKIQNEMIVIGMLDHTAFPVSSFSFLELLCFQSWFTVSRA
jgi:hypothetical protein